MKYGYMQLFAFLLYSVAGGCLTRQKTKQDGYRFVSFEKIPKGERGTVIGTPSWDTVHYIKKAAADSFYVYGNFDSIRMKVPADTYGTMFRRVNISTISWKPKLNYDTLRFVGNYVTDELPGIFISYYFTENRTSILQLDYTDPGHLNGAILFSKDSVNMLKKKGIVIDPRNEL